MKCHDGVEHIGQEYWRVGKRAQAQVGTKKHIAMKRLTTRFEQIVKLRIAPCELVVRNGPSQQAEICHVVVGAI